jgi:hypothetical protein
MMIRVCEWFESYEKDVVVKNQDILEDMIQDLITLWVIPNLMTTIVSRERSRHALLFRPASDAVERRLVAHVRRCCLILASGTNRLLGAWMTVCQRSVVFLYVSLLDLLMIIVRRRRVDPCIATLPHNSPPYPVSISALLHLPVPPRTVPVRGSISNTKCIVLF